MKHHRHKWPLWPKKQQPWEKSVREAEFRAVVLCNALPTAVQFTAVHAETAPLAYQYGSEGIYNLANIKRG